MSAMTEDPACMLAAYRELLEHIATKMTHQFGDEAPWLPGFEAKPILKRIRNLLGDTP
jgi:hypothetical protein